MEGQGDSSRRSGDKKPAPAGNQVMLYLMGVAIVSLFLYAVLYPKSGVEIRAGDFETLLARYDRDAKGPKYIDIGVKKGASGKSETYRFSKPSELVIIAQSGRVTGKIYQQKLDPKTLQPSTKKEDSDTVPFYSNIKPGPNDRLGDLLNKSTIQDWKYADPPGFLETYGVMLIITGLFVLLIFIMMRRMGGAGSPMAFGRSRAKLYAQEDLGVTFDDVAGVDEAVEELREVVEFLRSADKYHRLGGRIPRGVLLVGPPGTGKTLLAKSVAGEAGVPFFSLSGSDFVEMFVGVGAARVRDMFQQAEQKSPCIVFIDELDALGKTRGSGMVGGHDEREQTLNALLVEMDGFDSNSGVIVLAATNRPETLDPALLRPGRFDRHVLVDRPDIRGREAILKVHVKRVKLDEEVDLAKIAAITSGFCGADLANLVNEAALLAARNNKDAVGMEEFNEGVERVTAGLEKKQRIIHEDEKQRIAYHEAGHALVANSLPNTDPVHKISIIPRGLAALGYTMQRPEEDRFLMTQGELESRIQVLLAGTIAEELIFEDISTGAQNDLERATEIARSMVMQFGMSGLGRVNYRESGRNAFIPTGEPPSGGMHSEETAREIDEEVRRIIDDGLAKVRHVLSTRRDTLIAISEQLLEDETMDADQLREIVDRTSPQPKIVPGTESEPKRPAATGETASTEVEERERRETGE
ncbi:MAG: ATP-dependent zinc metalloprotease FtsH [Planctomycetota bacterium]|nr:MAG: ATP-dependent zinc metalloprotease FtsH [Planctomycetota bacterium]REJ96106.1 MAG: ATP-dependent zinc metalloprotease FtsH [Planctomycetota bacterium]